MGKNTSAAILFGTQLKEEFNGTKKEFGRERIRMANQVLRNAIVISPVGETGEYKDSWRLSVFQFHLGRKRFLSVGALDRNPFTPVFIHNIANHASFIEHGTAKMPARPIMRAAIESVS